MNIKKLVPISLIFALFILLSLHGISQPDPPGGGHGSNSNSSPGGGAPIGSGLLIMLSMGAGWVAIKIYNDNRENLEE